MYVDNIFRHQWIFITDTVDAVFRPDNWAPEALFDQLAEVVGSLPIPEPRVCTLLTLNRQQFESL